MVKLFCLHVYSRISRINNGIISSGNAAYSGGELFGATVSPVVGKISAASPFDFLSGYLGAGYYNNLSVTVQGRSVGQLLYSRVVNVGTTGAQSFDFGFLGVDEVDFFGSKSASTTDPFGCGPSNCTQFTLDDASVRLNASVARFLSRRRSFFWRLVCRCCSWCGPGKGRKSVRFCLSVGKRLEEFQNIFALASERESVWRGIRLHPARAFGEAP